MPPYKQKYGVEVVCKADGQHFRLNCFDRDLEVHWDPDSIVYTVYLDEYDAKELFWELLETIPKLRKYRP